jgi:hypothetical protein
MPSYDPQRARHRPAPTDADEPAPVDALLEPHPAEPALPEGVELELTDAGGALLHTAAADVEVTASGDDVVVSTGDASVEVRADDDEVVISAGGEEIYVDTTPREADLEAEVLVGGSVVTSPGRSKLVVAVLAALLTVLAIVLWSRRRR